MRFLILFLAIVLYAKNIKVFVDKNFEYDLPYGYEKKIYNDLSEINGTDSIVIIKHDNLPYFFDKNYTILIGLGEIETYIVSHKNLNDVNTVANANLPAKIFFHSFKNVKFVNASFEDFVKGRVDALVTDKKYNVGNAYYYDLDKLGIEFSKYYIGVKKDYFEKNKEKLFKFCNNFPVIKLNSSLIFTANFLNKKINISQLFFNLFKELKSDKLKVVVTPYWPPFNFNDKGELKGISIDYWKLIAKKANLDYELISESLWTNVLKGIKSGKYDIVPNTSKTPEREKYAIFSKPFAEFPLAIACRDDLDIEKIEDIKSLAVGKNYTAHKMMKKHYPHLNYIPAKNSFEAMRFVKDGKAQCFVDIFPTVVWIISQEGIGYIKIYFKTDFTFKMMVMLRKELKEVRDKINRAIDKISDVDKHRIISKYIDENVILKQNKKIQNWVYFVILALISFLIFVIYKYLNYKKKSEYDALTGIYNRGAIEKRLKKKLKEDFGSLIIFDIDHFKKINDNFGHDVGDMVLRNLAQKVKSVIRKSDYIGRWGGEEFVVVMPLTPYEDALKVAEKIRREVEKTDFDGLNITISLGVTEFKKGERLLDVVKRADIALYEAKRNGRNQVKGNR